jgi:hypothetical protein
MAERAEKPGDAYEYSAYKAYMWSLARVFKASETKQESLKSLLMDAEKYLNQYYVGEPLIQCLNAVYQGLMGPKPGDDLRLIIADFLVDGHQWKHYQNGDTKWGLFIGHKWEEVHKIIVYGAKLVLAARAIEIDHGEVVQNTVMDGFVQFDGDVGTPGGSKKGVSLIKIQISRTTTQASGHGYPVANSDPSFPIVYGVLRLALLEPLSVDNNSMRVKK